MTLPVPIAWRRLSWWDKRMVAFDTETTGVDVFCDRIVTATVALVGGRAPTHVETWLLNPGIDIPDEAAAIHGVTTAQAKIAGEPAKEGLRALSRCLRLATADGSPLVAYNASYDLTILQAELARYKLEPLPIPMVVDPLVIDRGKDPYRAGSRKLVDTCAHYGIELSASDAHDCTADALAAARLAWVMGPHFELPPLLELQQHQRRWHWSWATKFADYLRQQGRTDDLPDPDGWPVRKD